MALAEAQRYVTSNQVVNPYLFDVKTDARGIHPVKEREIIRAAGPDGAPRSRQAGRPDECIGMTNSTRSSWPSAWRSSATRSQRRLSGELTEDQFKPLRLMNGLYLQLHAYMLRVAVPYGTLSREADAHAGPYRAQIRQGLSAISPPARTSSSTGPSWWTCPTSWPIWRTVEMHASRPRGNCIRNVTADHFAGAAADEIEDPRPLAEIIRQWSSLHPEFVFLPRKFKIAVSGSAARPRRAASIHDMAVEIVQNDEGRDRLSTCWSAAAWDARPISAMSIGEFVDARPTSSPIWKRCCASTTSTDGATTSTRRASRSWSTHSAPRKCAPGRCANSTRSSATGTLQLPAEELARIAAYFAPPEFEALPDDDAAKATRISKTG